MTHLSLLASCLAPCVALAQPPSSLLTLDSSPWQVKIVKKTDAHHLQLFHVAADGKPRLVAENPSFLPAELVNEIGNETGDKRSAGSAEDSNGEPSRHAREYRLLALNISDQRLHITLEYHPRTTSTYQRCEFQFNLAGSSFPLAYFRTVTFRDASAGWLAVDLTKPEGRSCRQTDSAQWRDCPTIPVALLDPIPVPALATIPNAFSYSPPLKMRARYSK